MNIPQTSIVCIQGSHLIPYFGGYSHFQSFDSEGNTVEPTLQKIIDNRKLLEDYIKAKFLAKYNPKNVFLLGFGQGGEVALDLHFFGNLQFGAAISISGIYSQYNSSPLRTGNALLTSSNIEHFQIPKNWKISTEIIKGKPKNTMPRNEQEARKILAFLSERLTLRNKSLEAMSDVYEIRNLG